MTDPDDEIGPREPTSILDVIRHIVDVAVDLERRGGIEQRGSGRIGRRLPIDYDFAVRLGPDMDANDRPTGRLDGMADHLIEVRPTDDGLHITADLPTVDLDDLTVGIDHRSRRLVIARSGRVIERVPLGWDDVEVVDARFNNGILDIHIRPTGGSNE